MRRAAVVTTTLALTLVALPADAQRSSRAAEQIDALFATWDRPGSPGCALGVVEDGELAYERGYGDANLDWEIPIATDTVFYVGSVSKQFTAAAVALLALDGHISLDDDIREYFPEIPDFHRVEGAPDRLLQVPRVTVRQLVHHTSGLRDIYTLMALAGIRLEDVFTDEQAIALIAAQHDTNFAPGHEYLYSNSGYFLLAQLVERVTGKPLREYAEERIFAPLGMGDTHFHDRPGHVVERRAISYQRNDGDRFRVSYLGNFDKVGAGGLYTTVRDLVLWDRNFYTGDVGGDEFLRLIQTPGMLEDGEPLTYAFGLTVDQYRGLPTVSHGGSMMGFKAAFLQFPEQRSSVLITCNLGEIEPMELARRVADVWLASEFPVPPSDEAADANEAGTRSRGEEPLTAAEMRAVAGTYFSAELDVAYRLSIEDGALWLTVRNTSPRRVSKVDDSTLRAGGWRLELERDENNRVTGFAVDAGRVTSIHFVRR